MGSETLEVIGVCFVQLDEAGKITRNEVYFDRSQQLAKLEEQKQRARA